MVCVEGVNSPDRPTFPIVGKRLGSDRDRLGPVGCPGSHGEHEDLGPLAEQGPDVSVAYAFDVRLVAVVSPDRNTPPELFRISNFAEKVIAAELTVSVSGDPAQQELTLNLACA